jgi:hypothetical protein
VALDEREMAHAFFKIFVSIFKNYRDFLIFPSREVPEPASGFDERRFLQSVPQRDRDFFAVLFNTQAWQHFVERRTLPNASEPDVLFFDEAIVSKKNRSTFALHRQTPFLDDRSEEIVKTFVVPSPDVSGLPPDKTVRAEPARARASPPPLAHTPRAPPLRSVLLANLPRARRGAVCARTPRQSARH